MVSLIQILLFHSDELTRLWNLNHDNMEACKLESREFMPSLDEFFAEAIEQADPVNMVEEEYKWGSRDTLLASFFLFLKVLSFLIWFFFYILAELFGTQTMGGGLWDYCPGEVHTSSNQQTRSSKAWQTTWTVWSANWPKNSRWGCLYLREQQQKELNIFFKTAV